MKRFTPDNMDSPSREARRLLREVLEGINAAFTTLRDPARRTGYRHSLEYDQSTVRSGGRSAAVIQDDIFAGPAASSVGPLQPQPLPEPPPEPVRRPEPKPEPVSLSAAAVADTEVVIPSAADLQPPSEPQAAEPEAIEEPEPVEPEAAEPAPAEAAEAPTTTIPDTVELGKLAPQPNPDPLDKTGAALLANAAQLKEVLGDHLGAARLLEEALRSDPMNLQYRYSFELATGRYYLHVDRPADARRHLALAANLAPHGDLAAEELIAQIDTPNAPRKRSLGDTIRQYRKRRPPG
jgi:tetratricopeptide (TPR) repeat protein